MTSRPTLVRSIPFWILFVGSLALTGVGAWLVFTFVTAFEQAVRTGAADQAQQLDLSISTYTIGPTATAGAVILGAGLVGLLLTAALAAAASVFARPAEVVEAIDWMSEEETASADEPTPAPAVATASPVAAGSAEPVTEDPDVEVPSDTPAPPAADR